MPWSFSDKTEPPCFVSANTRHVAPSGVRYFPSSSEQPIVCRATRREGHERSARAAARRRSRSARQGAVAQLRRRPGQRRPRHLLGGTRLCAHRHCRNPGHPGRLKDGGGDHRGLPADVLRRLRISGVQQGCPGLRNLIHLDHQGIRPLRRLDRWLGGHPGHRDRVVQPRRGGGGVLLPVPRRPLRKCVDRRTLGGQVDQRGDLPDIPGSGDVGRLPGHHHHRTDSVRAGRIPTVDPDGLRWAGDREIAVGTDRTEFQLGLVQPGGPDPVGFHRRTVRFDIRVLGLGYLPDGQRGVQRLGEDTRARRAAHGDLDPADLPDRRDSDPDVRRRRRPGRGSGQRGQCLQRLRRVGRTGTRQSLASVVVSRRARF